MFHTVDFWGDGVGDGVSGARYCQLGGVAKVASDDNRYLVANEFICGRIALLLGLPVPPGVIAKTDDKRLAFISLRFGQLGERPPPIDPEDFVAANAQVACGVVAFDAWVNNHDRHARNLAFSREGAIPPAIFDHGHALFGPSNLGVGNLRSSDAVVGRGCLSEHVKDTHYGEWKERINAIGLPLLKSVVAELDAGELGGLSSAERDGVIGYLDSRRQNLDDLFSRASFGVRERSTQ
jgi:hypothetical protein